jgi:LysM repeat protein
MVCLAIIIVIASAPIGLAVARSNRLQAPGELLTNPGFEDPFVQEGSADIFVANGWQAWYIIPDGVTYPIDCGNNAPATCKPYRIPVYRNSQPQNARIPPRARSGNSQQWGVQYATYVAGVYQRVSGLTPGARLRFSAYVQGFNCDDDRGCFGDVGRYGYSYEPGDMQTRVGIDPTGGTSEFGGNVVWSSFLNPLDAFALQTVEAVAQGSTVTVFVWSSPTFPEKHTDVYVDDASLVVVGQGPAPATAVPTQPAGTPSPAATLPPGTTTYTIQSGDTLFAIALQFNLTLDQLLALNPGLSRDGLLQVGQVINVAGTPQPATPATAQPTSTSAATATPTVSPTIASGITSTLTPTLATSTPTVTPTLAQANSGLCLAAYDDQNGNGTRDAGEALLSGIQFAVKDGNGNPVTDYTTDSANDPHCLGGLADGRYTVTVAVPVGRTPTADTQWIVGLLSSTTVNVDFASRVVEATATPEAANPVSVASPTPEAAKSGTGSGTPLGLLIGGAMILLAVAAMAFGLSARRK